MECPSCLLRYNINKRRPSIITCGHTICLSCLRTSIKCRICDLPIDPNKNEVISYSLMEILEKDSRDIDKYVKVCFVGSSMVGKTSLIKRMLGNEFSQETVTTIGYDFSFSDRIVDDLLVRYQLWDSAGQEKYRAISPIHYKNADIVVIVYDVSQSEADNRVSYWIEETLINCQNDLKIIIVGNKTDITDDQGQSVKPIDDRTREEIIGGEYEHIKVSCKTGDEVDKFWNLLDNELRRKTLEKKKSVSQLTKQVVQFERKKEMVNKIKSNNPPNKIAIKFKGSNSKKETCC